MMALFSCPLCGKKEKIKVPENACLSFHFCGHCKQIVSAPKGECCVVCAFSDKKCAVPLKRN